MNRIIIVTANKIGLLADVSEILALANINIEDIKAEAVSDIGIISMRVNLYDKALAALQAEGFEAYTEDVILLKVEDRPGGLAVMAKKFKDKGLDVKSIRIVRRSQNFVIVAVACDKMEEAKKVVKDLMI